MISKIAESVTKRLLSKEMIVNEDRDIYEYALFVMFSYACFFVVSLVLGLLAKIPLEAVIFFVSFCLIRNFAGGIHSDSEKKCESKVSGIVLDSLNFLSPCLLKNQFSEFVDVDFVNLHECSPLLQTP